MVFISLFIGQIYFNNDGLQLCLIFQSSYKTIATFSGLLFRISESESKRFSNEKFKPHYSANKSLSAKLLWNKSRLTLRLEGSCSEQKDTIPFTPNNVVDLSTACYYYLTYEFQSESTLYIYLDVKEFLARSRRHIWSLSDSNGLQTHNHLVQRQKLNHLTKLLSLAKWLSVLLWAKWLWVQIPLLSLSKFIICLWIRQRSRDVNTDFTLKHCLFGAVKLMKNADPYKYKYNCYGIGFHSCSKFSLPDGSMGKNIIIFGVDMSSFEHIDDKKEDIWILGKGHTQESGDTTLSVEA